MLLLLRLLGRLICVLPERWVCWLGRCLGLLAFDLLRVRRSVTLENLHGALHLKPVEARRLGRKVYVHLATGALELVRLPRLTPDRARAVLGEEGLGRLRALLATGRGLLVLSAHLGQWDLLACAAARCGLPVNVVTRSIKMGAMNRLWMEQREACGVRLLPAIGSARAIMNALRRGESVAMLIDQHHPGGEPVPFFGRPATTSTALARVARVSGAPVVPVFLLRRGDRFVLEIHDPLPLSWSTDRQADVRRATAQLTRVLQEVIARHPGQWLWLHRRWKGTTGWC